MQSKKSKREILGRGGLYMYNFNNWLVPQNRWHNTLRRSSPAAIPPAADAAGAQARMKIWSLAVGVWTFSLFC